VKSHAVIESNEIADPIAKEAAEDKKDGTYVYDRIPTSTIVSTVTEKGSKNGKRNGKRH